MQRLKDFYHTKAYRKETNFQLNHFTLRVKDPELKRAIVEH